MSVSSVRFEANRTSDGVTKRLKRIALKGVMSRLRVDTPSELCSSFLKGGKSAFIEAIAKGLFPQNEYRSLE